MPSQQSNFGRPRSGKGHVFAFNAGGFGNFMEKDFQNSTRPGSPAGYFSGVFLRRPGQVGPSLEGGFREDLDEAVRFGSDVATGVNFPRL
jgi:hypothetical protein